MHGVFGIRPLRIPNYVINNVGGDKIWPVHTVIDIFRHDKIHYKFSQSAPGSYENYRLVIFWLGILVSALHIRL